jgi:lipopolysaccharide export LptBFGC system permease protein LptF
MSKSDFDDVARKSQRYLRSLERTWHLRFMLPVACISFWAFACGMGFAIGRGSRMVAVCLGVVTVVATLFPAWVLAKEVGERLAIDAAVWVWPPTVVVGLIGAWLLWRHR